MITVGGASRYFLYHFPCCRIDHGEASIRSGRTTKSNRCDVLNQDHISFWAGIVQDIYNRVGGTILWAQPKKISVHTTQTDRPAEYGNDLHFQVRQFGGSRKYTNQHKNGKTRIRYEIDQRHGRI